MSQAWRFGETDTLVEGEFYPRFRPGTYAFVSVGGATNRTLYPSVRFAFDLYQSLGRGFEVSGGARFLNFGGQVTDIYVGTLTKYIGNWMVTGRVYQVPASGPLDSTTVGGIARRYYGSDGTSYAGFGYSHGLHREEVYSIVDLVPLHAHTLRADVDHLIGTRVRLLGVAVTSRQERANLIALWQTSIAGSVSVQF